MFALELSEDCWTACLRGGGRDRKEHCFVGGDREHGSGGGVVMESVWYKALEGKEKRLIVV